MTRIVLLELFVTNLLLFSGSYGVTKYGSGWRKNVVNQWLEFVLDLVWATYTLRSFRAKYYLWRSDLLGCWGDGNPKKPILCPSHFIRALARCFSIHKTSLARCFPIHNTSLARCFPIHKTSLARCFQIHNSFGNVFATSQDERWQDTPQFSVRHVCNSGSAYILIMGRVLKKNISG